MSELRKLWWNTRLQRHPGLGDPESCIENILGPMVVIFVEFSLLLESLINFHQGLVNSSQSLLSVGFSRC